MRLSVAIAAFVVSLLALSAGAAPPDEFESTLAAQLSARDGEALKRWTEANAAREAGRRDDAIRLYSEVLARVPDFDHALRRRAHVELDKGDRPAALRDARAALAISRSSPNLAALALALASGDAASAGEVQEARTLALEATKLDRRDSFAWSVLGEVAIRADDLESLRSAAQQLEGIAPKEPAAHYYRFVVAASEGDWDEADAAIDRAAAAGLPDSTARELRAELRNNMPFYVRWWKPVALGLTGWFGFFAVLLLAGAILSRAAMHAARRPVNQTTGDAAGLSSGVRKTYRAVLFLSCVFYYVSIPIVMLLVLGSAGAALYGVFAVGHIPVKLVILIVVVAGVSVWSMVKSLFVRISDEDPGSRLDLDAHPKFRQVLESVAGKIGTRVVDNVYLTPGTEVAVMERGRGKKERCLILGIAALDGFAIRPFKAVLGHEYGHFSNRDTAGGAFALRVRNSLHATALGLAEGGAAAWYNPAWLFVNGFHRVFLRISEGASRLQEILADRWAVFAYGAGAFEEGLRHVVERSVRFDAHIGATLKEVVEAQAPLANLYTYAPAAPSEDLSAAVEESLNRTSSAYDSHPAPAERFTLIRSLPVTDTPGEPDDGEPVWTLFTDPHQLQLKMTERVRNNILARYGVEIAAAT